MYEKRKSKRLPAHLSLEISELFKQDNVLVSDINEHIEVFNVSSTGIGFKTKSILPLNFYFNACIELGDPNSKLYTVVKIVRREEYDDETTIYGCEFVGMPSVLNYIFEDYEAKLIALEEIEE